MLHYLLIVEKINVNTHINKILQRHLIQKPMSIKIQKIEKKTKLSIFNSVKYQIIHEVLFKANEPLSSFDLNVLSLLAIYSDIELGKFCTKATKILHPNIEPEEFAIKSQNIRNRIGKLTKRNFIIKQDNKFIINPSLGIIVKDNVLLVYNFLIHETN